MKQKITVAGMQVMVTLNVATEADLANGSHGTIKDIVLDPREELVSSDRTKDGAVWLQYPSAMILFQPYHHKFDTFPGLEPGLIPIFPTEVNFTINQNGHQTGVHHHQYPLSAAYAFTNHKSQGQTIEYVIVDIAMTTKLPITLFAAYVALSRSRGTDKIRLLRDFDDRIFTKHPSAAL
jgi:ATP-dependent exoDNAse (exonuclease V) alpha subunit